MIYFPGGLISFDFKHKMKRIEREWFAYNLCDYFHKDKTNVLKACLSDMCKCQNPI